MGHPATRFCVVGAGRRRRGDRRPAGRGGLPHRGAGPRRHARRRCAPTAGACVRADGPVAGTGGRRTTTRRELGEQDVVVLAVKAHALPGARADAGAADRTATPWWCRRSTACRGGSSTASAARSTACGCARSTRTGRWRPRSRPTRVIGCVVHLSASVAGPGHAVLHAGDGLILGEPAGGAERPAGGRRRRALRQAGLRRHGVRRGSSTTSGTSCGAT